MGILGEPLDIAEGVVYLASDATKFVTGTELVIDRGFLAR
jgi:NAD(P)-dependent dehydrogenase (short-subunit alcohol dehydrogenase family)